MASTGQTSSHVQHPVIFLDPQSWILIVLFRSPMLTNNSIHAGYSTKEQNNSSDQKEPHENAQSHKGDSE